MKRLLIYSPRQHGKMTELLENLAHRLEEAEELLTRISRSSEGHLNIEPSLGEVLDDVDEYLVKYYGEKK
jgi:hypothetical protein